MEQEILKLWQSGLSKDKVAEIYRRRYNEHIKQVRLNMHNRHAGRFISNYEALAIVEKIIYKHIIKKQRSNANDNRL